MENQALIKLLDSIIEEHRQLNNEAHRVYLASIARGVRLMQRYGANGGTGVPKPGPGFDEWLAGNSLFADSCNKIRELVGDQEAEITRRIRALEAA